MNQKLHFVSRRISTLNSVQPPPTHDECVQLLNLSRHHPDTWPFTPGDATAGAESELQVAVRGKAEHVDLPITIRGSNYYSNVIRRASAGDAPRQIVRQLDRYLEESGDIWENSWVRFPSHVLSPFARRILREDLQSDKSVKNSAFRSDVDQFFVHQAGSEWLRIPISYLLKLALADAISIDKLPAVVKQTGIGLFGHFLSDNTSPESYSFHVVPLNRTHNMGAALASEVARRHLLTHALVQYANLAFDLKENGQESLVFASPSPPLRQRYLNDCISDSFYRELFMSPCLSGWDRGEDKLAYMRVCHKTLSRSQLNTVGKLKEAGIIVNNLVVLPNTSSTSLANNGIHVSLGSRHLTRLRANPNSGFEARHEKYLGDLAIKIIEHFLPLFVGSYSAAPHRLGFADFHPERALGYLPHELDYTHLRMLWRRWKGKAKIQVFGKSVTPFGPVWLDELLGRLFSLKGDFLLDVRLIDYLVAVLSTENSPALNGALGNDVRLKNDLHSLGVFDRRMSLYQLYKLRAFDDIGYSGFEGRFHSLFPDFQQDLAGAVDLQLLLTALAYKYIIEGTCTHQHIPDTPFVESERRQIFFATAIGVPTFYVKAGAGNFFLQRILKQTRRTRRSRRYPGYIRVYLSEYRAALIKIIRQDGAEFIEMMGFEERIKDLEERICSPDKKAAWSKLSNGLLEHAKKKKPVSVRSNVYNEMAESFYRTQLNLNHLQEGFDLLFRDVQRLKQRTGTLKKKVAGALKQLLGLQCPLQFLTDIQSRFLTNQLSVREWVTCIHLILLVEYVDASIMQEHPTTQLQPTVRAKAS